VGVPLVLLASLEAGLRIAGFGEPVSFMIPDGEPGIYRSNPDFVGSFLPGNFDLRPLNFRIPLRKPPHALRVVVLGESAAQGIPSPQFGFAAQLRAQLRARHPDREVEVINTGIVAINSHVVYQIARQMAAFSPDLFVVYMGNNEVVGPYGPGCAYLSQMPPLWVIRLSVYVRSTRTGQLVNALAGKLASRGSRPAEWGGMAMFVNNAVRGDDPRLAAVYSNFEANLADIVKVASGCGAQTLLCTVVSNLRDCAPFLSLHGPGVSEADLASWNRSFNRGRIRWLMGDTAGARADLLEAQRLDPQYADTSFLLGSLDLADGNIASARGHLVEAEHWDALRFRPDPRINEAIRRVAAGAGKGVTLADLAMLMGSDPESSVSPAGRELLFEHVHPDWPGNFMIARRVAELAEGMLPNADGTMSPSLDSPHCADALAYTPHERFGVLQHVATIVQNPPFANQLTYAEDEARLAADLASAKAARGDAAGLRHAREVVREAQARDPRNPDLAGIAEEIDDDLGDTAAALDDARRAAALQPRSYALSADQAIKLSRLGRYGEAETLLKDTARECPPRDRALMAPAFADLYTRTLRFDEGRRYLDGEIARAPADLSLRLLRGRLARLAGDTASAEGEFRSILSEDPGNQGALEELVSLLEFFGRRDAAMKVTLDHAGLQPRNQANNLRAAISADAGGDAAGEIRYLLAADSSGPVNSSLELRLARKLFDAGRPDDGLAHLALAMRISTHEGDPAVTEQIRRGIEGLLEKMR
jgi:hypothetical protein